MFISEVVAEDFEKVFGWDVSDCEPRAVASCQVAFVVKAISEKNYTDCRDQNN